MRIPEVLPRFVLPAVPQGIEGLVVLRLLSRLKNLSDHCPDLCRCMCTFVCGNQSGGWLDVVIEIEDDRRLRREQGHVHGMRNRRRVEPDQLNAPLTMPAGQRLVRLRTLVDHDDRVRRRIERQQPLHRLDDNRSAVVRRNRHRDH